MFPRLRLPFGSQSLAEPQRPLLRFAGESLHSSHSSTSPPPVSPRHTITSRAQAAAGLCVNLHG